MTVNGGTVVLYSNDDGLHADGALAVLGGSVSVINSYEGAEGFTVTVGGGSLSVVASDDGVNATATEGRAVVLSGGYVYVYCNGDGIDANSRTAYEGIVFSGSKTVIISNSNGNSAIDTEAGYSFTGGTVLALMPSGGMTGEATNCSDFSSVATSQAVSASAENYLSVSVGGNILLTVKMPCGLSGRAIYLGANTASFAVSSSCSTALDANGVAWDN